MLEIIKLCKTFNPGTVNEKTALDGVSLTLKDGDFVSVIGGNGAGKSTLLNAVAGTWLVPESTRVAVWAVSVWDRHPPSARTRCARFRVTFPGVPVPRRTPSGCVLPRPRRPLLSPVPSPTLATWHENSTCPVRT